LKFTLIVCCFFSFGFIPSFALTESVNLFGQTNSADLILNDIWIEPKNPKTGDSVSIHGSVYNAGIIPSGEVSDVVTIGYIVNGELLKLDLLENILPGIKNGVEISSGPIFDAVDGNYIVTVIVNYHDTLSHLRDNPENDIIQKHFQIGNMNPSILSSDVYQYYDTKTETQQITIQGELTDLFQQRLKNHEIIIDIGNFLHKKTITDMNGKFSFNIDMPFVTKAIDVTAYSETNSLLSTSFSQTIYPIKLDKDQSSLALEIIPHSSTYKFENPTFTIVLFQDSYDELFEKISTNKSDKQNFISDNVFLATLPANHEYIAEIYFEGRFLDAFQTYFPSNAIIKKEIFIPEPGQIQFKIVNKFDEPQPNAIIDNWIYHTQSNKDGFTDWLDVIPTIIAKEPYVAKVTFPDGKVTWSEPFMIESGEKKVIQVIQESNE
jgi:hypothetical protein